MKPYQANLFNAAILIIMGIWGYFASDARSLTALIPVGFGVLFLLATGPFKNDNKVVAHILVVLTLVLVVMLISPLRRFMAADDTMAIMRIGLMMLAGTIAFIIYIKSFVDARKARESS